MGSITDEEVEVAEILRNLPKLIQRFKSNHRRRIRCCRLVWTVKKRRSSITLTVPTKIDHFRTASPSPMETNVEFGVVQKSKAAAMSPASPLCFDLSGGEEAVMDTGVDSVPSSPCSRQYKNGKVQDKEWIEEKKSTVYALLEENKNLHQEAVDIRNRYKSLVAENSRLKEIKSKWKTTTGQKRSLAQEEEEQEKNITLPSLVVLDCPTISQIRRESTTIVRAQSRHEPPIASTLPFNYKNHIPLVAHQFWNLSGFSGGGNGNSSTVRLPDLNAHVEDNGVAVTEQQRQRPPSDARKMATAEARKKRIEINRRKAAMGTNSRGPFRRENRVVKDS